MKKVILFSFLLITAVIKTFGAIRYVTPAGVGAGTSWADASGNLQAMITASGVNDEVWVRFGTYSPGITRASTFSMKNNVTIYGSFAGTETLLSQRILTGGLTSILSSEIGGAGNADNCYHTITNTNLNNTAIIDGFVIRDANDDRPQTGLNGLGGGIFNNGGGGTCSPTIRNCVIINNSATFGGGIFNNGSSSGVSSPVIFNCIIANNTATSGGGGIDNFAITNGNASPIITNCVIYNNTATSRAGGMYCWGGNNGNSSPIVLNTHFAKNSSADGGGVVCDRLNASGGGSSGNANPNFRNCTFWGNTASGTGPQFIVLGSTPATFTATYSDIDMTGQNAPHIISGAGTGNLNADPLFTNIDLGPGVDGNWMTIDDGLTLSSTTSPCYNSGDNSGVPTADIINYNRIANGTVDMGAYEFNSSPLPISLISFTANCKNKKILKWITASEINNNFFSIERSLDAINWKNIGIVDGAGNSSTIRYYTFTDVEPSNETFYYRLKQTDFDSKFEYSKIVAMTNCEGDLNELMIYPNPTNNTLNISLNIAEADNIVLTLFDINGQLVKVIDKQQNTTGSHYYQVDLTQQQPGIYFLTLKTTEQIYIQKIIRIE